MNIYGGIGKLGGRVIDDTTARTPSNAQYFSAFLTLTSTVIDTISGNITGSDGTGSGLNGVTIPAGMLIEGVFASIQLSSGTIIAYEGSR